MEHYDVVVIGSGFGGSVAALRLTEKGYKVLVLEAGARFDDHDFAKTSWDLKKFLFFPKFGMLGIQRIDLLKNVMVMSGAGVGGGSLVYANTLYRPSDEFYSTGSWAQVADWKMALAPYYDLAERMLGVVTNPFESNSDQALKKVAERMGFGDTYRPTPVGVYFGKKSEDPFFGGAGPVRQGCINCGECMTGCRHNAKNTLVKNYLYFAEKGGAQVRPLSTVTTLSKTETGFDIWVKQTNGRRRYKIAAEQVVVAAGALGTAKLLHRMKNEGHLNGLSDRLGFLTRTNSESLLGVVSKDKSIDFSQGSAITSSVYPDSNTHIEPVRYGHGSNFMAVMQSLMSSGKHLKTPNPLRLLATTITKFHKLPQVYNFRHWSERTLILLVMQAKDNSLITYFKNHRLTSRQGDGEPNPAWVPIGHQFANELAKDINGTPGAVTTEAFGIPMTAHFLGGATIGASAKTGVVDGYLRAFGVPGLHIFDGSTLSANPGVNPSLSITAQAEWACAHWPNKGEKEMRPSARFKVLEPIAPKNPLVPKSAPAALRLSIRTASK